MSPEASTTATKVCPTCGTRLNENATRCLVCGRNFAPVETGNKTARAVRSPSMPQLTLSLPVALGLLVLVLAVGAGIVFAVLNSGAPAALVATDTVTPTITATATQSPTTTLTNTPLPTFTPLPPVEYTVQSGDFCSSIAAFFNVSINSIVVLNNLSTDCALTPGQKLLIPQPTPTASPQPSATLSEDDEADSACEKYDYTVAANDTLSGIAGAFNVSMDSIREYNGMTTDVVYEGMLLKIPLCERLPTPGPTATPTPPPPYSAPNLLLPADGSTFMSSGDTITLQWASVGTLRENESYAVTIEDITEGTGRKLTEYVTDTKFIVPSGFRPAANEPHIIRWTVTTVRQAGTAEDGTPIWTSAGAVSISRVFSWVGGGTVQQTPTP